MKRVVVALMMTALVSTSLIAQNRGGKGGRGAGPKQDSRIETLAKELDLDAKQQTEIKAIFKDHKEAMRSARAEAAPAKDQMRKERVELCNKRDAEIEKILSKKQYEKYLQMCEEKRAEKKSCPKK